MAAQVITLLGGRVKFLHTPSLYAPTSDAVWAAAAVEAQRNQCLLEPGFGTGALGLCLLERLKQLSLSLVALELQTDFCAYARKHINLNGRMEQVHLIQADVRQPPLAPTFVADHSVANPPFYLPERGFTKASPALRAAHGLTKATLTDWLTLMADHTDKTGTITLINHTDNLPTLLDFAKKRGLGAEVVRLVTSPKRPPKRVIVRYTGTGITRYTLPAYDDAVSLAVLRQGESLWRFVTRAEI
jgi:tRNA1(Val) A37 N6-methylase TrmN6